MKETSPSSVPEFISTHPSNETRINNLQEFIPEANRLADVYK
jgi:predicted Zn-dependent protease